MVIHDGIRPLVDDMVLTDVIRKAMQYGNAVTALPYNEQIFVIDDDISTVKFIPRETIRRVATPQAYRFDLLDEKYHEAFERHIADSGYCVFGNWNRSIKPTSFDDSYCNKAI